MEARFLELIHAEIDGRLSPRERENLMELMAHDESLREEYEQLKALTDALAGSRAIEPPRGLRASIMREIASSAAGSKGAATPRRPLRLILRYGYAFAAGLVLGIFGLAWYAGGLPGSAMDRREISGSMSPIPARQAPVPLARMDIDAAGVSGSAALIRAGTGYSLQLDLSTSEPIAAGLAFDGREISLRGVSAGEGGLTDLRFDERGLSWTIAGRQRITIELGLLSEGEAEIRLEFEGPDGKVQAGGMVLSAGK